MGSYNYIVVTGRILALDVGRRRVGLAISDALGITAQGLPTLQRGQIRSDMAQLARLVRENGVVRILVGLPLQMSGSEGRQAEYVREFGDRITRETGLPVVFWDERYTTVEAEPYSARQRHGAWEAYKGRRPPVRGNPSGELPRHAGPLSGGQRSMTNAARLGSVFLVLLGVSIAALMVKSQLFDQAYAGFQKPVFVEIPKGTSTIKIGDQLAAAGVIRHPWQFALMRLIRVGKSPQAGDYQFRKTASAAEIFDRIARGDVFFHELRVPEGSNLWDIAAQVEELDIVSSVDFLVAARNPQMVRDLVPQANSLEGYLFPATYKFKRRVTAEEICRAMTNQFRRVWKEIGGDNRIKETVTLASMVEKEAKLPGERPRIAGVYASRIKLGMRMDCDPTVIYAALLENRYRGTIYQSDLNSDNPYNTYKKPGLPPGPIANPGIASLQAALKPETTTDLFFVAKPDGSGSHVFSASMKAHSTAVADYRKGTEGEAKEKSSPSVPSSKQRNGGRRTPAR